MATMELEKICVLEGKNIMLVVTEVNNFSGGGGKEHIRV